MTSRRQFLTAAAAATSAGLMPSWARTASPGLLPQATLRGPEIALTVAHTTWPIGGKPAHAVTVNGTIPAPLIRLKEGETARLAVTNRLDEDTSIHWHGLLVPFHMDGVPGISFPGIRPGETFVYEFPIVQSGTYWYHSHSGLQEPMGHYGPLIIDPAGPDPVAYDREHIIVLSDYSRMHPHTVAKRLKQQPGFFNHQKPTLADLFAGRGPSLKERLAWGEMRMDPTDISDVTGSTYTFLINGHSPIDNWTGLFQPGERVRLRFINASAMTIFNVRIPGLPMSVVQSDGLNVRPVETDEFQIAVAETYDVIVQPTRDQAFTLVAEAVDRSGMVHGILAPRPGMRADIPPLRERPLATMKDMGMGDMDHGTMDHSAMNQGQIDHSAMNHDTMDHSSMDHSSMDHGAMDHAAMGHVMPENTSHGAHNSAAGHSMSMRDPANAPTVKMGPGIQMISPMPVDRTGEPGQGLENVGHRVLKYTDLVALDPNPDTRAPGREIELHLTGNMERFMWAFDGVKFSDAPEPLRFRFNERVRIKLVNDTMMAHPIHFHGHFFEVVNGHPGRYPRKHTVNVAPGGLVNIEMTADAPGDWALHCHLLFHMHAGMFQIISTRAPEESL